MFLISSAFAQKKEEKKLPQIKWGEISRQDREMTIYPLDSSADAVVLDSYGTIELFSSSPPSILYSKHKRVKILKKSAFESQGAVIIEYFRPDAEHAEKFDKLRAQVIYKNGTVRPLKNVEFVDEKFDETHSLKKILFPALEEGCILEYEYQISSAFNGIFYHNWYFQEDIPTRYSFFKFSAPRTYGIVWGQHGSHPIKPLIDMDDFTNPYSFVNFNTRLFCADSVPSIKSDAYMATLKDYITSYYLQLSDYSTSDGKEKSFLKDWSGFTNDLYSLSFGNFTHKKNYIEAWNDLKKFENFETVSNDSLKIEIIYRFVKSRMDWNGEKSFFPQESLNKAYLQKKGNSADLNMLLIALLNEAGLKSFPLILSTRSHGKPIEEYPIIDQYNYLLSYTELNGRAILLDATDSLYTINMPRIDALNRRGVVLDKKKPHWIDIIPQTGITNRILTLEFDKNNNMSGNLQSRYKSYDALTERHNSLTQEKFDETIKKYFSDAQIDVKIDSASYINLKALDEPFNSAVYFKINDAVNVVGDIVYINPTVLFDYAKNPFKQKERKYPVDIPYPERKQFSVILKIPEGYEITDLPKSLKLTLIDDAATFQYAVSTTGQQVQYNIKLNINRLQYSAENYKPLKDFFDQVAAKVNEPIVLKKK